MKINEKLTKNLQEQINELESQMTDSGWKNLTTTFGTWSSLKYRKINNLVTVYGYASSITVSSGSVNNANSVATLPTGYRPSYSQRQYATGVSGVQGRVNIATGGGISLDSFKNDNGSYSGTGYLTFTAMFYVD